MKYQVGISGSKNWRNGKENAGKTHRIGGGNMDVKKMKEWMAQSNAETPAQIKQIRRISRCLEEAGFEIVSCHHGRITIDVKPRPEKHPVEGSSPLPET
jgi:hypothetical protein